MICSFVLIFQSNKLFDNFQVWILEISACLMISITSGLYHLCDANNTCIIEYIFLRDSDLLYSLLVLTAGFTIHVPNQLLKVCLNIICSILVYNFKDDFNKCILPIILINIVVWSYYNINKYFTAFYRYRQNFGNLSCSIVSIAIAYFFKTYFHNNYDIYHSLWHLFAGLAIIFSSLSVIHPSLSVV